MTCPCTPLPLLCPCLSKLAHLELEERRGALHAILLETCQAVRGAHTHMSTQAMSNPRSTGSPSKKVRIHTPGFTVSRTASTRASTSSFRQDEFSADSNTASAGRHAHDHRASERHSQAAIEAPWHAHRKQITPAHPPTHLTHLPPHRACSRTSPPAGRILQPATPPRHPLDGRGQPHRAQQDKQHQTAEHSIHALVVPRRHKLCLPHEADPVPSISMARFILSVTHTCRSGRQQ